MASPDIRVELDHGAIGDLMTTGPVAADITRRAHAIAAAGNAKVTLAPDTDKWGTRIKATIKVDKTKYASLCQSGRPFEHTNCSATKAMRDAHVSLMAALGATR